MSATVGLRVSAWQNATDVQREALKWVVDPFLGSPALYETGGGVQFFVFADHRLDMLNVARLGCLVAKLADLPPDFSVDGKTGAEIRQMARDYVQNHIVWPVVVPDGVDPYQAALDAQNTPAALQARAGIPEGLTPVSTEEA